jgi:hypothetical protein
MEQAGSSVLFWPFAEFLHMLPGSMKLPGIARAKDMHVMRPADAMLRWCSIYEQVKDQGTCCPALSNYLDKRKEWIHALSAVF